MDSILSGPSVLIRTHGCCGDEVYEVVSVVCGMHTTVYMTADRTDAEAAAQRLLTAAKTIPGF